MSRVELELERADDLDGVKKAVLSGFFYHTAATVDPGSSTFDPKFSLNPFFLGVPKEYVSFFFCFTKINCLVHLLV